MSKIDIRRKLIMDSEVRIDKLVENIENSYECKEINKRIKKYFQEILSYLPVEKKILTVRIDDCMTEMLIIYQKLYDSGFIDGINSFQNKFCQSYQSDFKSHPDTYDGNEKSNRSTKH
ncbi:MAG: hypothetical protein N2645_21635 [Clostridia bacterium]|nr:hypothetical protein [Clostridia bacterium]